MTKKTLSNLEVIDELKSKPKVYIGIMPQSKFWLYCNRIERGVSKPHTVISFFIKFGYVGDWNNFKKKK